jgi:Leucine-rich repeat (LRR) protein
MMRYLPHLISLMLIFALPSFAQDSEQTPYGIALRRIEEARVSGATELNLAELGLSELPPAIGNLINLIALDLSYNRLSSLPPQIAYLQNLQVLDLYNNQLSSLPPEIGNLTNLQWLWLDNNPLISPPPEIVEQGTAAILDYLRNEAWWQLQRLITGAATSLGLMAALVLGFRWKTRRAGKKKRED